jgi:hypothetical protein
VEFQGLYECLDSDEGAAAWNRAKCAKPDELTPAQCANLMEYVPTVCVEPYGGWSPQAAAQYQCSDDCATAIYAAYGQCQTTWTSGFVAATTEQKISLFLLVNDSPEGPCRATFREMVSSRVRSVATDRECGPKLERCSESFKCRAELREAIGATLYTVCPLGLSVESHPFETVC